MSNLTSLNISELRKGLDSKTFSAVEVATAFLKKAEDNSNLNSFIELCKDSCLAEAEAADKSLAAKGSDNNNALLGIPVAVKDVILTKGIKTTCASRILANFVAPYDATVTKKLKAAGALIIGKTNMDEFAMGSSNENSHFGPVKNPWDIERVPGGSSGGSAVAVSARLAPVALGTDTGGSIRQPASLCSVVGLRPTYGRVSRYGVIAYASSLDQVGSFANTVKDCAILTEAISGHDPLDATSGKFEVPNFQAELGQSIKGMRVGIPKEYFIKGLHPEVEAAIKDAFKVLSSLGAEIVEISLPHTELAVPCYYVLAPAEASSNLARYDGIRFGHRSAEAKDLKDLYSLSRSEGFGAEVKRRILIGTYVLSSGYYDAYYIRAQKVRSLVAQDFRNAFKDKCDVIACPTTPTTAFRIGEKASDPLEMYLNDIFTIPVNLAGLPGISLPCGFDKSNLPIGLQIIGNAWEEAKLFRAASAYESATEWHKKSPEL